MCIFAIVHNFDLFCFCSWSAEAVTKGTAKGRGDSRVSPGQQPSSGVGTCRWSGSLSLAPWVGRSPGIQLHLAPEPKLHRLVLSPLPLGLLILTRRGRGAFSPYLGPPFPTWSLQRTRVAGTELKTGPQEVGVGDLNPGAAEFTQDHPQGPRPPWPHRHACSTPHEYTHCARCIYTYIYINIYNI